MLVPVYQSGEEGLCDRDLTILWLLARLQAYSAGQAQQLCQIWRQRARRLSRLQGASATGRPDRLASHPSSWVAGSANVDMHVDVDANAVTSHTSGVSAAFETVSNLVEPRLIRVHEASDYVVPVLPVTSALDLLDNPSFACSPDDGQSSDRLHQPPVAEVAAIVRLSFNPEHRQAICDLGGYVSRQPVAPETSCWL
ncbi:unnamed protein product [Protopolystoma xenopodis]|uniref:Uncharacterized protein n=1 Tax=Protopolystoma xenopodis TaxID=117903 RepID=A0A448XHV9_9PLAT|nr:unnamed protein product [Protopolystoma xenopodis]